MRHQKRKSNSYDQNLIKYQMPNGVKLYGLPGALAELRFIYDEVFTQKVYQRHGIKIRDGDCLFDVGANIGLFTMFATQQAKRLSVFAFEPMPLTIPAFRANVESMAAICGGLNHDIKLFEYGISSTQQQVEMTWYPRMPGNSTLFPVEKMQEAEMIAQAFFMRDAWKYDKFAFVMLLLMYPIRRWLVRKITEYRFRQGKTFSVRLRSLGSVLAEHEVERIDLLKIDVEGAEFDVLDSLSDQDWSRVSQLVIEVSPANVPRIPDLIRDLEDRGFRQMTVEEMPGPKLSTNRSAIPRPQTVYALREKPIEDK